MKRVVVHIDRLVLRGVAPSDREAFTSALCTELTERLAEPTTFTRLQKLPGSRRLRASTAEATAEATASARVSSGTGAGRAIVSALTSGDPRP